MVFAARIVRLGGVHFSVREAQFLGAGIRRGMGVRDLRAVFRSQFNRGLPSPSFTAARRLLTETELELVRFQRRAGAHRFRLVEFTRIEVQRRRFPFRVTARATGVNAQTGVRLPGFYRMGFERPPTRGEIITRIREIMASGEDTRGYPLTLGEVEGVTVAEQVEIGFVSER